MLSVIINRKIISAVIFVFTLSSVSAQISMQQVITNINKSYDSTNFLTFDVRFTYNSDTLAGDFKHDVLQGSYTLAGKKMKYNLGDIDFIQNDSFFIAVYNDDKYMLVSDPRTTNAGSQLPMRQVIDSMVNAYGAHYTITMSIIDSVTGKINFARADTLAQFENFAVTYYTDRYYLRSIQYVYREQDQRGDNESVSFSPALRRKTLTIDFLNYRVDNFSADLYNENSYIWFEDGECKPVKKYKDFKIYNSHTGIGTQQQVAQ